jgi:hypothetical protein
VEVVHSWHLFLQPQYSRIKSVTPALCLVSGNGVMFNIVIGSTKYECKILTSNFNWSDCDRIISCLFALLTSQKGEGCFTIHFDGDSAVMKTGFVFVSRESSLFKYSIVI